MALRLFARGNASAPWVFLWIARAIPPHDPDTVLLVTGGATYRECIALDGRPLYTSDTVHHVLDASGTRHVEILLRRVG